MAAPVVLFGGTFDPVHHGHLIAARAVAEARSFERVTLLPAANPPHKRPACASAADRLEMLRRAVRGEDLFDVSADELRRAGPSYTFDTLQSVRRRLGPDVVIHLVVGADMLADLPNWHRGWEIPDLAEIVVASRPPWQERIDEVLASLRPHLAAEQVRRLAAAVVPTPLIDISSTDIRRRVRQGKSIRFLVPEAVRAHIEQRGLYGARPRGPRRGTGGKISPNRPD